MRVRFATDRGQQRGQVDWYIECDRPQTAPAYAWYVPWAAWFGGLTFWTIVIVIGRGLLYLLLGE